MFFVIIWFIITIVHYCPVNPTSAAPPIALLKHGLHWRALNQLDNEFLTFLNPLAPIFKHSIV